MIERKAVLSACLYEKNMESQELLAAGSLATVFSVRLLGLFMIYPVFADYAQHLTGSTPYKIGLALGIYGLSQGLLQIPFGLMSDKVGRKIMIVAGLVLFAIGSAVAAISTTIDGVIIGRLIQGAGAVGSVILALVADLTAEENRTKAMAMVGITIGGSFLVALVAGPIVASFIGVSGIFWLMVGLAFAGIAITLFVVPTRGACAFIATPKPFRRFRFGVEEQGAVASRFRHFRAACDADGELPGAAGPLRERKT